MTLLLVCGVILAALLGMPLFAMFGGLGLGLFYLAGEDMSGVVIEAVRLASAPALGAIPLFTFAGFVLAKSKAPQRLVDLSQALIGWMPGGLAVVALVSCAFFTAFTGASGVTIIALGGLLYPILLKDGYKEKFSLGLLTTTGSLGLLFPPSLPLILYGIIAEVDINRLFMAGILPGALLVGVLSVQSMASAGAKVVRTPFQLERVRAAVIAAAWEIPLPVLVLVGIYGGFITATEAAAVTAAYVIAVEVFIRKEVRLKADLPAVAVESMTLVGGIIIILSSAMGLTSFLIMQEVPMKILATIEVYIDNKVTFLVALNLLLLVVGCLMDIFSALVVVVPLILPIAARYGVDPTHLGIIFLTNLEIGYLTPPVGLNLFLSSYRFEKTIPEVVKSVLPFIFSLTLCLVVITYWPALSLWLPNIHP